MGEEGRGITQFGDGGWRDEVKGIFRLGRWLCEKNELKFIINFIKQLSTNRYINFLLSVSGSINQTTKINSTRLYTLQF